MLAAAQVRHEVAQRLLACALTGSRVHEGRYYPASESELPCWFVAIESEECEPQAISYPGASLHRLRVVADGFVLDTESLESQLDTLQAEGLTALFSTQPPWPLRCLAVRRTVHDAEGADARAGRLSLFLEATFLTTEGDPHTLHV
jgi:hypothetical protein